MNRSVEFVIPYPPSANRYWRVFRGRPTVSAEAKAYKEVVAELVAPLMESAWDGPVRLEVAVFRPRKAGDLSNCLKVLEDALRGIVFLDDSQTVAIHLARFDDAEYPRAQVHVSGFVPVLSPAWDPSQTIPRPRGWEGALAKLELVRQKRLSGERRRAAKRAATPAYKKGSKP